MCLDGEKNDRVAFQARADYQNHAIGWLHRGYSSLGGGKVVRIPRIWMAYGECRLRVVVTGRLQFECFRGGVIHRQIDRMDIPNILGVQHGDRELRSLFDFVAEDRCRSAVAGIPYQPVVSPHPPLVNLVPGFGHHIESALNPRAVTAEDAAGVGVAEGHVGESLVIGDGKVSRFRRRPKVLALYDDMGQVVCLGVPRSVTRHAGIGHHERPQGIAVEDLAD